MVLPHAAQYFSPLFDAIAADPNVALRVVYGSRAGLQSTFDAGFGRELAWDLPLVDGYPHIFLDGGVDTRGRVNWRSLGTLIALVRSADVVVVHGHSSQLSWVTGIFASLFRVPFLTRSDATERLRRPLWDARPLLARWFARCSSGALASSERNARLQRDLGSPATYLVPLTVDVNRFARQSRAIDRGEVRRSLGLPEVGPVVGYVGKFLPNKRPIDLLDAVNLMSPRPHVLVAGDGPLREALQQRASGVDGVSLRGFQNQRRMPEVLSALDVLVLPSEHEPWGLIVNEALSCGVVPVVSDRVGCGPELVEGVGQIYPVGNLSALASALTRALTTDRTVFRDQVESFIERYSMEAAARRYVDAVQVVQRKHKRSSVA